MLDAIQQFFRPYRQGDVLLAPCVEIPPDAFEEAPEEARVVLARGERSGHAHAMAADRVRYFREDETGSGFIQVTGAAPVDLTHEEHAPLGIPPGNYRVIQQREYQPRAAPRAVDD